MYVVMVMILKPLLKVHIEHISIFCGFIRILIPPLGWLTPLDFRRWKYCYKSRFSSFCNFVYNCDSWKVCKHRNLRKRFVTYNFRILCGFIENRENNLEKFEANGNWDMEASVYNHISTFSGYTQKHQTSLMRFDTTGKGEMKKG